MRRFAFPAVVVCLVALTAGVSSLPVYADTYKIYNLGDADANVSFGITDDGTAVVRRAGACNPSDGSEPTVCYYTYVNGIGVAASSTSPDLKFDNGVVCDPGGAKPQLYAAKCNGGYDAFTGGKDGHSFYVGPVGRESVIPTYSVSALQLNAVGDAFWTDGAFETIYEAVDLTPSGATIMPEPSTLVLMGSGLLGVAGAVRRRVLGS